MRNFFDSLFCLLLQVLCLLFQGLGTNEAVLIEILASRTNAEIHAVKDAYRRCKNANREF